MNLYYALATITDTDDSEIVLEWYYYEHDFGGVELVTDSFEHDLVLNMTGTEWRSEEHTSELSHAIPSRMPSSA